MFALPIPKIVEYIMKSFLILFLSYFIITSNAYAQCSTSTCITADIIGTGQNALVDNATAVSQMAAITGTDPAAPGSAVDCTTSPLIKTGATVYRWYSPAKIGQYKRYADSFCLSQGCNHQGGLSGTSICGEGVPAP